LVGFVDDFIKIRKQRSLGLRARAKFGGQLIVGVAFAMLAIHLRNKVGLTPASTHLSYLRDIPQIAFGSIGFVVIAYVIISATSNAVNLTDGLDGLAAGASAMVFGAFTLIAFLQYRTRPAERCTPLRRATRCATRSTSHLSLPPRWPRASGSCGGTPHQRRSSWATPDRWRWAD